MIAISYIRNALFILVVASIAALPVFARKTHDHGKLKIHVSPKQAYVFVDGKAIRDGSQTIKLSAGTHEVGVYNYGYLPKTQEVKIQGGETADLRVELSASGDKVSGPFGDIEFKGHPRAAVLLNGTTPAYFVGHVDEFDWNWIWHQRLLVRPGTYQVTITREGNTIWTGPVSVKKGQQVTVSLDRNGATKTKNWPQGDTMGPQPRFYAGVASATIPISPVSAQLSAQSSKLTCGQSTQLNWKAADAVDISLTHVGNVAAHGDRSVSPSANTTYELVAKGPGGEVTKTISVGVDTQPTASLTLSQPEIRFHKIGDKVVEQDSTTLNWTTSNASKVMLQPFGSESTNGSQTVQADPRQMAMGPINQEVTYRLTASNACGGTATGIATFHMTGSIDPAPAIKVANLFYPTAYPTKKHPKLGLVAGEQAALADAAKQYEHHELYDGNANLRIVGYSDVRGSDKYNMALSERRAELAREFLEAHGVPADRINIVAEGKRKQLDEGQVAKLQTTDPQKPENWKTKREKATWLAYNRRVDLFLEPTGQPSAETYPNNVASVKILWQMPKPSLKVVEMASKTPNGAEQASMAMPGK